MVYTNSYKIIWSPDFIKELDNIYEYVCSHFKEAKIATNLYIKIANGVSSLSFSPERHRKIDDIKRKNNFNLRRLPIDKYVIIYEVFLNTRTGSYFTYLPW